ncbi:MAG: hypothetical protein OXE76_12920 [Alphaproteobacteria bacterium]|nr:hypothetical protein [Alphaproteobacteria bacterium]
MSALNTAGPPTYIATGSWFFTPDGNNAAQIVEQDSDHMHFGWWVETPTNAKSGGEFLYDVHVFHDGTVFQPTGASRNALTGKATYNGSAAGLYAVKAHMDDGTSVEATRGEFTADVSLTADFKTTAAGDVSGTIEDFVRDDGVENTWSLKLEKTTIVTASDATTTGISTGSIVSDGENTGQWEYNLYGTGKDNADPTGIAGRFNSKIGKDTAVAGGFAATRQ